MVNELNNDFSKERYQQLCTGFQLNYKKIIVMNQVLISLFVNHRGRTLLSLKRNIIYNVLYQVLAVIVVVLPPIWRVLEPVK